MSRIEDPRLSRRIAADAPLAGQLFNWKEQT